jgi:ATP-binding cassette, subfamily B, bacterial CvaB/MchF/RaxB
MKNPLTDALGLRLFRRSRTLPLVRQTERAECALACLSMICGYYGKHLTMAELRAMWTLSITGTTLRDVMQLCDRLALSSRPVRLDLEMLAGLQTPCILHWNLNHFVVLKEVRRTEVVIHDPSIGLRRLSLPEVSAYFTGVALELQPTDGFTAKQAAPTVPYRTLFGHVKGLTKGLLQVGALAIILELLALASPQFMQLIIDQVFASNDQNLLVLLGCGLSVVLVLNLLVTALRSWTVNWMSASFLYQWGANVFHRLVRLPHRYFLTRNLGDIVSRFGAIGDIQSTLTTDLVSAVLDGALSLVTLGVLFYYSWPLATATVLFSILYVVTRSALYAKFRERRLDQIVALAEQQTSLMESIRGVETLQIMNRCSAQEARYLNLSVRQINAAQSVNRFTLVFSTFLAAMAGLQHIAVLWLGATSVIAGQMTAGMLIAFLAYADQFNTKASSFVDYLVQLRLLRLQADRLADIVLTEPEQHVDGSYSGPLEFTGIELRNVSFRYGHGEPWVLRHCNLTLNPGEAVCFVGPSGGGKSTLAKLIVGMLDPEEGDVIVSGVSLRHFGKHRLREMTASVLQSDHLFTGTIAENVAMFDEDMSMELVFRSCQSAQLDAEIRKMPMGYQTPIGDMGTSLSGGQRQRLMLARALYRTPRILVLDEATSHLDIVNEALIVETLRSMDLLRVSVAHRPETIQSANRVIRVQDGKLSEFDWDALAGRGAHIS